MPDSLQPNPTRLNPDGSVINDELIKVIPEPNVGRLWTIHGPYEISLNNLPAGTYQDFYVNTNFGVTPASGITTLSWLLLGSLSPTDQADLLNTSSRLVTGPLDPQQFQVRVKNNTTLNINATVYYDFIIIAMLPEGGQ